MSEQKDQWELLNRIGRKLTDLITDCEKVSHFREIDATTIKDWILDDLIIAKDLVNELKSLLADNKA